MEKIIMFKQSRLSIVLALSLFINIIVAIIVLNNIVRRASENSAEAPTIRPADSEVANVSDLPTTTSVPTATELPPTATSIVVLTDTAVPSPTNMPPTATSTPEPTITPLPTDTPPPTPTNTPLSIPQPNWLVYMNQFREAAHLPLLSENLDFTAGSAWHSSYMILNDEPVAHNENPTNAFFDEKGDLAARQGNIFATTQTEAQFNWAINFWFSAPFHALPLLDPRLAAIGYGDFVEDVGAFKMAAVTNVRSGLGTLPASVSYPVFFPGDGAQTWITRLSMNEWPDPYANCPGYQQPTGPAIVMQLGTGELVPHVTAVSFTTGDKVLAACTFNETNYANPDAYAQETGRSILNARDAVVIIPREQLAVGQQYTVFVTVNGETFTWSFEVVQPPPVP